VTAPLDYVKAVADQASARSVPGSTTVELARLTREVVAELRAARLVVGALRHRLHGPGLQRHDEDCPCALCAALTAYDHDRVVSS